MLLNPIFLLSALTGFLPSAIATSPPQQQQQQQQQIPLHVSDPHSYSSRVSTGSDNTADMLAKAAPVIHDALIIGGGPAGLSAALSLARVCRTSAVFDSGEFRNRGAEAMHSFLSRDGIAPEEFRAIARSQIEEKYSEQVSFFRSKIVKVAPAEIFPGYKGFEAVDSANVTYRGKKLVLATGTEDVLPTDIEGYADNWPSHIYQCPFCDGFEQRAYPIGMLTFPNPSYLHFALMVMPFNKDITIFSNGGVPSDEPTQAALKKVLAAGAKLDDRKVKRLVNNGKGPENGITVEFETGPPAKLGMLLHRPPTRSRAQDLIEQLGLETKPNGDVIADAMMLSTNVPGCVVAGDTYESIKQALMASSNGLRAAAVISFQLASEDGDRALAAQEAEKGGSNL